MNRRPIIGSSKTGKVTRLQARKAAIAAKSLSSKRAAKKSGRFSDSSLAVESSFIERYLGHFGGSSEKKSPGARRSAAKSSANSSPSANKGLRRAS